MGAPTLRAVAERAGVSLATASCALSRGRRSVSPTLRNRVFDAARELGYQPRPRGRPRGRSLTVGAVVPEATNSFFCQALRALQAALTARGHRLVVASSGDDPSVEDDLISRLASRIDGLVLTPAAGVTDATRALAARDLPVVLMDRDGDAPQFPSVSFDNFESARRATRVLLASGQRHIAIVNGPSRIGTARQRLGGYRAALSEAGVEVRDDYVRCDEFDAETARQAVHELLRLVNRPEAIFSASPISTSGVLLGLRDHRLRWPDDMAVVAFGDGVWASLVEPAVTVVEQPTAELGATAASLLLARTSSPHAAQHVVLSSRLVLRDSHWRSQRQSLPLHLLAETPA